MEDAGQSILHASCVALDALNGVLILGPSGAGKSTLALQLMAYGAYLVADDRVALRTDGPDVVASAPESISGLIEARGVGILRAQPLPSARIRLVVDLSRDETERLPPKRETNLLDRFLPLVLRVQHGHLDLAVLQWLKGGRHA
ncbi:HPr kinase/phosphorylase [Sedimentimonas flavescens]|uniref:HPr kinase/phosphorylase n=1 Tax=Sedimentimonas flavescens TaxID=2851012 RepID=UPI001C4A3799|nr:HPr kinase/phosphatase C-terminal domain-containing protein [Sedimentimonas flavescens]MBW0158590.1 HPr kinase/phosphatase C-terminal domain-containing protein [Sedimentimonas flavescens]